MCGQRGFGTGLIVGLFGLRPKMMKQKPRFLLFLWALKNVSDDLVMVGMDKISMPVICFYLASIISGL